MPAAVVDALGTKGSAKGGARGAAASYSADGLLRDGTSVRIRAIRPDDKERLQDHFHRLGPESVRHRFFGAKPSLSEADLRYFTELDFRQHVGLVASRDAGAAEEFLAVGRYIRMDDDGPAHRAEMAVAVADTEHGLGLGTLVLEHLAGLAARDGIAELVAYVLPDNRRMVAMLEHSGFVRGRALADDVLEFALATAATDSTAQLSELRAWSASAESMRHLLHPRSVAVIGASRDPAALGRVVLDNLAGFHGPVYAVNPTPGEIGGRPCFARVTDAPAPVDLAVIVVPAPAVEAALADCAAAGVRGAVVITAGFAEVSEEGRAVQARLRATARQAGMRLVGPNCLGVMNAAAGVRLNATFAATFSPPGNVGLLSQSGALGLAVLEHSRRLNLGISTFVSVGNKADVSGNDLLAYWKDDPQTAVVALYLESFGNPRRFARLAPEVARRKPVVAVKSGRSAAGTRAASSHSAALACQDVAVDALFAQAGVIRTETLEDLYDVVGLLATQPVPAGPRVGVVTNAGGPGILLADACDARGLSLPELRKETREELRAFLPAAAGVGNPVDVLADARPEDFARAVAAVGRDPEVDALVVIYVPPRPHQPEAVAAAVARGAGEVPGHKPVLSVFLSTRGAPPVLASGPRGPLPSFSFPENAARALAAAERYGRWRRRPRGEVRRLSAEARARVREVVEPVLAPASGPCWLGPAQVEAVLDAAGIARPASRLVSPAEAADAADEMGYPLVAKAVAPGLVHKTEAGGVALGLGCRQNVEAAVSTMDQRLRAAGHRLEAVLLQAEVRGGIEALVGVVGDPTFGPLVVCGTGGVQAELLRDTAFRLTPVSDLDAAEMLDGLRLRVLLDGYRGAPAGDRQALQELVRRVSALTEALPELREMDLNPVRVLEPGRGMMVLDARILVAPLETTTGDAAEHPLHVLPGCGGSSTPS
jgi:acetate---CoA ligase (ADP-forming)